MEMKVCFMKHQHKLENLRKYLHAFVTNQLTSMSPTIICFHIGNSVFVCAHLCCTQFLKLFSHAIAAFGDLYH